MRFFNINLLLLISFLFSIESRPLSMKSFDVNEINMSYNRGSYLIVLPSSDLEPYMTNENYGGDFVKFKRTQGFDVDVVYYNEIASTAQGLKDYILDYYNDNPMLEYLLLVGDVNGAYSIPTFTIDSYNEEDIDVTDYPYTFTDDVYKPHFFVGRWPVRNIADFINIKSRSIQYVKMDYADPSKLNEALLVAGNYKTSEGALVAPVQWPVTPVWTSLWLMDELDAYGYNSSQIDTAFFHKGYCEDIYDPNSTCSGIDNPLIQSSWNEGVGVINYRGWGDANGWHMPYFHRDEASSLNNGWNLPVVLSFVCNTGDFGNDYSGTGLNKCFGEVLVTAGSITNPKGAAAMVGPSDLDTDTRFNNVICGVMWDALLEGKAPELAPALHYGKQALTYEFSGLSAPDGTVIDEFYHHVYGVLGDPSISTWLLEPQDLSINSPENWSLNSSYISVNIADVDGNSVPDAVGALINHNGELIGKAMTDETGLLLIDFDSSDYGEIFTLYINKPQFKQESVELTYVQDDGQEMESYSISLSSEFSYIGNDNYLTEDSALSVDLNLLNRGNENIGDVNVTISADDNSVSVYPSFFTLNINAFDSGVENLSISCIDECNVGETVTLNVSMEANGYLIESNYLHLIVSSNSSEYLSTDPNPPCDYGYWAFDNYDSDYEQSPSYEWVEINQIGENLNLADDTIINDVPIGFDFNYFGETYSSITVCSNGWASFDPGQLDYFWNFSIPNPMGPSGMLAPFMDDLDDNNGTEPFNVFSYSDQNGRFIIQWDDVSNGEDDQNCPNCIKETFQLILHDPSVFQTDTGDGEIIFQYKEIHDIDSNGNYSTIGIESLDQNDGIQYLFSQNLGLGSSWIEDSSGLVENLAIKFTTNNPYSNNSSSCMAMDVNQDGVINVVDIVNTVNIIFNVVTPSLEQECAADANEDGVINVVDIVTIVNFIFADL